MAFVSGLTPRGVLVMFLASFGSILFGFDNGWWGTILGSPFFLCYYGYPVGPEGGGAGGCNLSTPEVSAGSGVQSAGIMLGCLIAIYMNDIIGRRRSLLCTGIISVIGVIIELTSAVHPTRGNYGQFLAGKVIASISMGLACNIVPVYLSETTIARARGLGVNMYQTLQIVAVVLASACVYATSTYESKASFAIPMGIQLVAPIGMILVYPWLQESPRWLVWKGQHDQAISCAKDLFGTPTNGFSASEYCTKLSIAYDEERKNAAATGWNDVFRQPDLRRLLIAVGIQSLQQAQGSSYMNSYIVSFLQGTGVTEVFPVIMGLNVLYLICVSTGYFLPDMYGRRPILISTALICCVCLLIIASLITAFPSPSESTQKASIALIFIWYASFGVHSPLVWITTAESAPTRNREKVIGTATFVGFGVSLLIAFVSPYIQNPGYGGLGSRIGFIWGSFSFLTILFVYLFIPEMKGFSLEQLDYLYERRTPTRAFKGYHFADDVLASENLWNGQGLSPGSGSGSGSGLGLSQNGSRSQSQNYDGVPERERRRVGRELSDVETMVLREPESSPGTASTPSDGPIGSPGSEKRVKHEV